MKILQLFCCVLFLVGVLAQRRNARFESSSIEPSTHRSITNRGRAKFTTSPEFAQIAEVIEPVRTQKPKSTSRRRIDYERHTESRKGSQDLPQKPRTLESTYEVQEVVDDIPRENPKRPVLRQTTTSTTTARIEPLSTTTKKEDIKEDALIEEQKLLNLETTTAEEISAFNSEPTKLFIPETSDASSQKDFPKNPAPVFEISKDEPRKILPRAQLKSRTNIRIEEASTARNIQRVRPVSRLETSSQEPEIFKTRSNFKRRPIETILHENSRNTPSVFSRDVDNPVYTRSRTGRKIINHQKISKRIDSGETEIIQSGILTASSRRRETVVSAENEENSREINKLLTKRTSSKFLTNQRNVQTTTEIPVKKKQLLQFDETKLEVLPLFESDNKTEKLTAVDSFPEITKTVLESTTPLTTPKVTTDHIKINEGSTSKTRNSLHRRTLSRPAIKEVKNNKIDDRRSSRGHSVTTTTSLPSFTSRNQRANNVKHAQESSTVSSRGRGRHNFVSSTVEPPTRRKQEPRVRPKKIEPTVSETRLQNLSPRRGSSNRRNLVVSTTTIKPEIKPRVSPSLTRRNSRFNKMEDELLGAEELVGVLKNVKNSEETVTQIPKRSRNTKRGTTRDHSSLSSSEEAIDETDNYPEPFKALIQAKLKQKESRSRSVEEGSTSSTERHLPSARTTQKPIVISLVSSTDRNNRKDEDNELHVLNSPPTSRRPINRQQKREETEIHNKINYASGHKSSTVAPPSTSTTKLVLTSISSKVTRQRFHARFKADSKNKTATLSNRSNGAKSRYLAPPKAATGIYSSKKGVRSTTIAPKVETTTHKKIYSARGNTVLENVSSTETPQIAAKSKPKSQRFSAKYRSDVLRGTGFKTTASPVYIPTVPTVTPYVSTSTTSGVITEENELGMKIISLDEPVKITISSADLIRDDYLQSSSTDNKTLHADNEQTRRELEVLSQTKTEQVSNAKKPSNILESILNAITSTTRAPIVSSTVSSSLKPTTELNRSSSTSKQLNVGEQILQKRTIGSKTDNQLTTEKSVSIFERIIQSLTQNSTTTTTTPKPITTTTTRSTIQRIPSRNEDQISFGTPRSVIENILNSLSSIRSITETTTIASPTERVVIITKPTQKKVNNVSSTSDHTPMASFSTKRTTTGEKAALRSVTILSTQPTLITSQESSTLDPVIGFLNEISTENTLQKRTLSTLISLLNLTKTPVTKEDNTTPNIPESTTVVSTTDATTENIQITTPDTSSVSEEQVMETTTIIEEKSTEPIMTTTMTSSTVEETTVANQITTETSSVTPTSFWVDINSVAVSSANDISAVTVSSFGKDSLLGLNNDVGTSTETVQSTESYISELPFEIISTTKMPSTTTVNSDTTTLVDDSSLDTTTLDISSNTIEPSPDKTNSSNKTSTEQVPSLAPRFKVTSTSAPQLSTVSPNKDYYLFAILPNNTVVRKRPSMYPTKETPFLIVGIYPNNTIIRKFPNGTLVPEEPVIQVRGFDTRANPPDIISNQVTPNSGLMADNTLTMANNSSTADTKVVNSSSASIPTLNELLNGTIISTTGNGMDQTTSSKIYKTLEIDPYTNQVKTDKPGQISVAGNTVFRWKPVTSPAIIEIGNTVNVNDDENISTPSTTVVTITPSSNAIPTTSTQKETTIFMDVMQHIRANLKAAVQVSPTTQSSSTTSEITTEPSTTSTTTTEPSTTTETTTTQTPKPTTTVTTTNVPTTKFFTTEIPSTVRNKINTRERGSRKFLSTTEATTITVPPSSFPPSTTITFNSEFPKSAQIKEISTEEPERITITPKMEIVTPEPTVRISATTAKTISSTLKTLTEEQKKNLQTLAELEKEQAAILKQLSFLTNLIPGGPRTLGKSTTSRPSRESATSINSILDSLNKKPSTTKKPSSTSGILNALSSTTTKQIKPNTQINLEQILRQYDLSTLKTTTRKTPTTLSLLDSLSQTITSTEKPNSQAPSNIIRTTTKKPRSTTSLFEVISTTTNEDRETVKSDSQTQLEQLLKQYNLQGVKVPTTTVPSSTTPYGKSNDAILAALLKEQGIRPNTPKLDLVQQLQRGAAHITTTPRPGMIMQSLNWLLNRLAPVQQPTPRPTRPQKINLPEVNTEEILTRQPTKLTPVIYDVPDDSATNAISSSTIRPRSLANDLQKQEEKEIALLLKQIQTIQKDPIAAQNIVKQFTGKNSATYTPGRKSDLSAQELVVLLKEVQAIQNDPKAVNIIKATIKGESVTTTTTTTTTTTRRPTTSKPKSKKTLNDLSPEELSILLKQIQTLQRNPSAAQNVDLSKLLGNQPSLDDEDDFESSGASHKLNRSPLIDPQRYNGDQNFDTVITTTKKPALPPVAFRPVSGIPDGDSQFRGRLVNAAVSVTRAFTSFLGNALQGASNVFSSLASTSSRGSGSW